MDGDREDRGCQFNHSKGRECITFLLKSFIVTEVYSRMELVDVQEIVGLFFNC